MTTTKDAPNLGLDLPQASGLRARRRRESGRRSSRNASSTSGATHSVPDLVIGTSVGSLNGAVIAADPTSAANRLSHAWVGITRHQVFPGGLLAQAHTLQRSKNHLFQNWLPQLLVDDFLGGATTFDDLALPFSAVTTDVATAEPFVLEAGPLLPALLASAAIPGIFPSIPHDGRRLCDNRLRGQRSVAASLGRTGTVDCCPRLHFSRTPAPNTRFAC